MGGLESTGWEEEKNIDFTIKIRFSSLSSVPTGKNVQVNHIFDGRNFELEVEN